MKCFNLFLNKEEKVEIEEIFRNWREGTAILELPEGNIIQSFFESSRKSEWLWGRKETVNLETLERRIVFGIGKKWRLELTENAAILTILGKKIDATITVKPERVAKINNKIEVTEWTAKMRAFIFNNALEFEIKIDNTEDSGILFRHPVFKSEEYWLDDIISEMLKLWIQEFGEKKLQEQQQQTQENQENQQTSNNE